MISYTLVSRSLSANYFHMVQNFCLEKHSILQPLRLSLSLHLLSLLYKTSLKASLGTGYLSSFWLESYHSLHFVSNFVRGRILLHVCECSSIRMVCAICWPQDFTLSHMDSYSVPPWCAYAHADSARVQLNCTGPQRWDR